MTKSFIKKQAKNKLGYRTPEFFRRISPFSKNIGFRPKIRFTQHKG